MKKEDRTIIAVCSSCHFKYRASGEFIGQTMRCRKCDHAFTVMPARAKRRYPLIGRLALKFKLISEKQLLQTISDYGLKKETGRDVPLEEFLVERKLISPSQMDILRRNVKKWEVRQRDEQYGAIAVKSGFVTAAQIREALAIQARHFKEDKIAALIGNILVEAGLLTQKQHEMILARQQTLRKDGGYPSSSVPAIDSEQTIDKSETIEGTEALPQETSRESDDPVAFEKTPLEKIELTVSDDGLAAYIRNRMSPSDPLSVDEIKDFLQEKQIQYGIVDDALIEGFIKSAVFREKQFKVASGIAPKWGKDAIINYYFETEYLKSGELASDGTIDFKERGKIPNVEKGTLLAEKIAAEPGEPGIDVYGEPINVPKAEDRKIFQGSGVELVDDGRAAYAIAKGQPRVTLGGRVSVCSKFEINGDVGYKTGHIDYDGNVVVKGGVQAGFRVKCVNLFAMEITGAEIEVTGDVTVSGIITEAVIRAGGNVSAMFISKTRITTLGNVVAKKQIIDSTIENSGSCIVEKGKIVSSAISSKMGIKATDIGTEVSSPCKLKAGVDEHLSREVDGIKQAIERRRKSCREQEAVLRQLEEEDQQIQKDITVLAHVQDRAMLERKSLKEELARLNEPAASQDQSALIKSEIEELELKVRNAESELEQFFEKQDRISAKTQEIRDAMNALKAQIEELNVERSAILEWSKKEKGLPVVEFSGALQAGTIISGIHASTVLKETARHATIRETRISDPDSPIEWRMQLQPLRSS